MGKIKPSAASYVGLRTRTGFPKDARLPAQALLIAALLAFGTMALPWIPMVLVLTMLLACFATGLGLMLAAANVYFRDLSYLWGIFVQLWFFATPIVYPINLVAKKLTGHLHWLLTAYRANPMAVFVEAYRRCLYESRWPSPLQMACLLALSAAALSVGLWVFARLSPRFAEEI